VREPLDERVRTGIQSSQSLGKAGDSKQHLLAYGGGICHRPRTHPG
jgi:hypothetical protein